MVALHHRLGGRCEVRNAGPDAPVFLDVVLRHGFSEVFALLNELVREPGPRVLRPHLPRGCRWQCAVWHAAPELELLIWPQHRTTSAVNRELAVALPAAAYCTMTAALAA